MNETKNSVISLLALAIAFFCYSAFIIYEIVEMKKMNTPLLNLMKLNSKIGIISVGSALIITKGISLFYFKKKFGVRYGESRGNKFVWILEKFAFTLTGFSLASMFWLIPFMGLKNR